jgi:Icc-related predicted phosphoesterase
MDTPENVPQDAFDTNQGQGERGFLQGSGNVASDSLRTSGETFDVNGKGKQIVTQEEEPDILTERSPLQRGGDEQQPILRFVCISDTHTLHEKVDLAEGDVLIHCGDFTARGPIEQVLKFNDWLGGLKFKHKIVVAGNHEMALHPLKEDPQQIQQLLSNATYLQDSAVEIEGLTLYGSPWISRRKLFLSSSTRWAFAGIGSMGLGFALPSGSEDLIKKWQAIPEGVDILVTHSPPFGVLDVFRYKNMGCPHLRKAVSRVKPKVHVFGHVHDAHGVATEENTTFINAANYLEHYRSCVVFDYNLSDHSVKIVQNKTTGRPSVPTSKLETSSSSSPSTASSSSSSSSSSPSVLSKMFRF